jgi:choice-of-anchor A domain-containing protein
MNRKYALPHQALRGCFLCVGLMVLAALPAAAVFVGSVDLGTAGPDNYTLLTVNTATKLTANNESAITGNVGLLGGAAKFSTSGDAFVDGTFFVAGPTSIDPSRAAVVVTNADAQLEKARTDAFNAASFAAGLAPTITMGLPLTGIPTSINGGFGHVTLTGGVGTNVLDLWDLMLSNNDVLTLDAPAGSAFILNISHDFKINGSTNGGRIELSGGLTPLDVLYNVKGAGSDVAFTGGTTDNVPNAQIYGTILAPDRSVQLTSGIVFGEVVSGGQELTLTSGPDALAFTGGILPEVSAFAPLCAVLSLASIVRIFGRNRRRQN